MPSLLATPQDSQITSTGLTSVCGRTNMVDTHPLGQLWSNRRRITPVLIPPGCQLITCADCGAENSPDAVFCRACNHYLEWDAERSQLAQPSPRTVTAPEPAPDPPPAAVADPPPDPPADPPASPPVDPTAPSPAAPSPAAPSPPPPPTDPPPPAAAPAERVHDIIAAIDAGQQVASRRGRDDLGQHLEQTRSRLATNAVSVVVVGEFKRGKSTLINALLQSAVCPVDADVVTAVPTTVSWSREPRVSTFYRSDDGSELIEKVVALDDLELMVTEEADPGDPHRERSVEVGLPHRMLQSGLRLVDTPGVGGLDSAHGFLTLGALRWAQGVLFVTDAAQELTGPELAFLQTTIERCPLTALVITKTDLYPQWRRIVELDRGHLATAGIDLPVIAVSSFLRLRAAHDPELNAESGFGELVTFLARDVVAHCRSAAARGAAREVEFVADQLEQESAAERAVLAEPERREQVVAELDRARTRSAALAHPTATWQQLLADGVQDLFADVEHDLQGRLRTVLTEADKVIEQGDPQSTWADTEVWLRRQIAIVTEQNRDLLTARALELAADVAEQFDLQAGTRLSVSLRADEEALAAVALAAKSSLVMPGGKLAPLMMAARTSLYLPMVMGSVAVNMIPGGILIHLAIAGISAALGAGIGTKIIRDERSRQRTYRQQQAKAAVRRFVDEVAFLMNKQTRDGLRATQRQLRDNFSERALLMQASASAAMAAAQQAAALDGSALERRGHELAAQAATLDQVRSAAREVGASA